MTARILLRFTGFLLVSLTCASALFAQTAELSKADLGSKTAKEGFNNEREIAEKFNDWQSDSEAQAWLATMNYKLSEIKSVHAVKPHGEKSDVQIRIQTKDGESIEGISIKLVSNPTGFNQIDKRWLKQYAKMWTMPANVSDSLKYFVGEVKPNRPSRYANRMFLNELDAASQKAIVDFFSTNKERIVSDIFEGDGAFAAEWFLVALKNGPKPRWILKRTSDVAKFYSEGSVVITRNGNLKIGRITMQRKGGDAGRETAKMLQFKINPALLFNAK